MKLWVVSTMGRSEVHVMTGRHTEPARESKDGEEGSPPANGALCIDCGAVAEDVGVVAFEKADGTVPAPKHEGKGPINGDLAGDKRGRAHPKACRLGLERVDGNVELLHQAWQVAGYRSLCQRGCASAAAR
eukprot:358352-Chlamydomonas_euryale.AAC.7